MENSNTKILSILLVEDNPGDVELIRHGLLRGKIVNKLYVAEDGEEALAFLRKEEGYQDQATPDLIMLDINLPKINGHQVLKTIRSDSSLSEMPVFMLSSSSHESDMSLAVENKANGYITKPLAVGELINAVRKIDHFKIAFVESYCK